MTIDSLHSLISWRPPIQHNIIEGGILLPETRLIVFGPAKS